MPSRIPPGGLRAILTALKTDNLAGIVMYENVGYVYPTEEGPGGRVGPMGPVEVPLETFRKLTKVPMQVVWGDNIDRAGNMVGALGHSRLFCEKVNKYGGHCEVLLLPEVGLKGNTHLPFADLNNVAVADELSKFLAKYGLDQALAAARTPLPASSDGAADARRAVRRRRRSP